MIMSTTETLEALYGVAHWLVMQERHADALSVFRTMLLLEGTDPRGWLGLGACHEALGETEKAVTLYTLASSACGDRAARCSAARARLVRLGGDDDATREAYALAREQAIASDDDELAELLGTEVPS
jgi:cytochrome c-type biogenesis protein CcmH/NrfG